MEEKWIRFVLNPITWLLILVGSGLIISNTLPYFTLRTDIAFLQEKEAFLNSPLWRAAFFFHISGGLICLISAPFQFWSKWALKRPRIHRMLGKVYVFVVLFWAAPAGIFLSFFSKGGFQGHLSFFLLGACWWALTLVAYQKVRNSNWVGHISFMIRSYAFALSAVSFRYFQMLLFYVGLADETNYIVSLWLSLAASLITGELFSWLFRHGKIFKHFSRNLSIT